MEEPSFFTQLATTTLLFFILVGFVLFLRILNKHGKGIHYNKRDEKLWYKGIYCNKYFKEKYKVIKSRKDKPCKNEILVGYSDIVSSVVHEWKDLNKNLKVLHVDYLSNIHMLRIYWIYKGGNNSNDCLYRF